MTGRGSSVALWLKRARDALNPTQCLIVPHTTCARPRAVSLPTTSSSSPLHPGAVPGLLHPLAPRGADAPTPWTRPSPSHLRATASSSTAATAPRHAPPAHPALSPRRAATSAGGTGAFPPPAAPHAALALFATAPLTREARAAAAAAATLQPLPGFAAAGADPHPCEAPARSGRPRIEEVAPGVYAFLYPTSSSSSAAAAAAATAQWHVPAREAPLHPDLEVRKVRFSRRHFTAAQAAEWWAAHQHLLARLYPINLTSAAPDPAAPPGAHPTAAMTMTVTLGGAAGADAASNAGQRDGATVHDHPASSLGGGVAQRAAGAGDPLRADATRQAPLAAWAAGHGGAATWAGAGVEPGYAGAAGGNPETPATPASLGWLGGAGGGAPLLLDPRLRLAASPGDIDAHTPGAASAATSGPVDLSALRAPLAPPSPSMPDPSQQLPRRADAVGGDAEGLHEDNEGLAWHVGQESVTLLLAAPLAAGAPGATAAAALVDMEEDGAPPPSHAPRGGSPSLPPSAPSASLHQGWLAAAAFHPPDAPTAPGAPIARVNGGRWSGPMPTVGAPPLPPGGAAAHGALGLGGGGGAAPPAEEGIGEGGAVAAQQPPGHLARVASTTISVQGRARPGHHRSRSQGPLVGGAWF